MISGKDKGKTGKVLRVDPKQATGSTSRASTSSSATSARRRAGPNAQVRRDRAGGPDPRLQRGAAWTPRTTSRRASASRRRGRPPHARDQALGRRETRLTWHDSRTATTTRSARRWSSKFGYSSPMQAPELEKITLNMGVGEAKQDAKMLEAAKEQLAHDRRPAAERPPRPQVRRGVQAARGHAGRPDRDAARRARVRVPRPPDRRSRSRGSATSAASTRARSTGAATTRWASASRSSSPRSTTTPSTRCAAST